MAGLESLVSEDHQIPENVHKIVFITIRGSRVRTMKFIVFITKILYTYTSVASSSEVLLLPVSKNVVKV